MYDVCVCRILGSLCLLRLIFLLFYCRAFVLGNARRMAVPTNPHTFTLTQARSTTRRDEHAHPHNCLSLEKVEEKKRIEQAIESAQQKNSPRKSERTNEQAGERRRE